MDKATFIHNLREALDFLEHKPAFGGPYVDEFELVDDGVIIHFSDRSRIRLTIKSL